jgi:hypothetical protein
VITWTHILFTLQCLYCYLQSGFILSFSNCSAKPRPGSSPLDSSFKIKDFIHCTFDQISKVDISFAVSTVCQLSVYRTLYFIYVLSFSVFTTPALYKKHTVLYYIILKDYIEYLLRKLVNSMEGSLCLKEWCRSGHSHHFKVKYIFLF